ncbi:MAG: 1-acyl-sn-glycerol-3-phosphate acyltransferase [Spirochaetes bacterium]|uniref:1-acyl-sn-glycerol-3-phosphate acyltransferase n=1 Tax=Candidatus Ornithospirochaeta stercoripullorum TaxID=2840899 RepID=A0A9D9H5G4_9SPIO|nr:1-acyl-sn-glycerol-3-phosphate acyltransferase [Candidatus Ornithospirochaeta stercoripullorum]
MIKKRIRVTISLIFIAPVFVVLAIIAMALGHLLNFMHLRRASEKTVHFLLDILVWWIFICLGMHLHIEGKENIPAWGKKVCYIANHQSMIDIPVLYGSGMWCGLVAKQELFRIPLLHGLLKILKCVAIDRSSLRASLQSILKGVEQIKQGYPMGIFPEGTRSKTGEIAEMKAGAFKMATKPGALVVPVAMKNTRNTFEAADSFRIVQVYVKIMEPVDTSVMSEEELKVLHTKIEEEIKEAYALLPGPYDKR